MRNPPMNIQRAYELLEIGRESTLEQVREAYKDQVNVWHPDRFPGNPRLRVKAEEKLKDINLAYETITARFARTRPKRTSSRPGPEPNSHNRTHAYKDANDFCSWDKASPGHRSKTEVAAEIGTGLLLHLCSYVTRKVKQLVKEEVGGKKAPG